MLGLSPCPEAQKGRVQSTSEAKAKKRQSDIIELLPASLDSGGVRKECNTAGF